MNDQTVSRPAPRAGSRALFKGLEVDVYANHASISPPSLPVRQAVADSLAGYARRGMAWYRNEVQRRRRVRAALTGLIGAEPGTVGLTGNTSLGVLAVALNLDWRRGDRVLLLDGEFPANVIPWQQAARRHNLALSWLDSDEFRISRARALSRLEDELKQGVRLLAVSAVQFSTGQRMPLEQIGKLCHQYDAELFVDAIQAVGIVPLNVQALGIDYLASGSHKWLMAPEGAGLLYVAPQRADALQPNLAGWLSQEDPFAFLERAPGELRYDRPFIGGGKMLELGTPATLAIAGLEASLDLIVQLGVEAILDHVHAWHDRLEPGLAERGFASARMKDAGGRSGILSVRPDNPALAPAWAAALAERGIACASPDGWLRLAPHWPNSLAEPARILAAVDEILAGGGPGQG
ncbi:MAG TPA: aminotransferase class V-fold PLP-dependent enzyme [Wenzhouxiangella sp.]|nr:aminotransferase class V-fold PLP-dependent enzyme [Wenzhouxiangella sp.]